MRLELAIPLATVDVEIFGLGGSASSYTTPLSFQKS
jgi:hypothetical protein